MNRTSNKHLSYFKIDGGELFGIFINLSLTIYYHIPLKRALQVNCSITNTHSKRRFINIIFNGVYIIPSVHTT